MHSVSRQTMMSEPAWLWDNATWEEHKPKTDGFNTVLNRIIATFKEATKEKFKTKEWDKDQYQNDIVSRFVSHAITDVVALTGPINSALTVNVTKRDLINQERINLNVAMMSMNGTAISRPGAAPSPEEIIEMLPMASRNAARLELKPSQSEEPPNPWTKK